MLVSSIKMRRTQREAGRHNLSSVFPIVDYIYFNDYNAAQISLVGAQVHRLFRHRVHLLLFCVVLLCTRTTLENILTKNTPLKLLDAASMEETLWRRTPSIFLLCFTFNVLLLLLLFCVFVDDALWSFFFVCYCYFG